MNREQIEARIEEIKSRLSRMKLAQADRRFTDSERTEWNDLNEELNELNAEIDERDVVLARMEELGDDPTRTEGEPQAVERFNQRNQRPQRRDTAPNAEHRSAALRCVEERSHELSSEAADMLDSVIRRDSTGIDSRYLRAIASDDYDSAFGKKILGLTGAEQELTDAERAAMLEVGAVQAQQRAMGIAEGALGQFAAPFALDPTVNLTSNGAVNPLRQLARVEQVDAREWRGITSAGVVAGFGAEAAEAEDNSPELAQPEIPLERAFAWVPFSYELSEDWPTLRQELARLFADAKDVLEATKLLTGEGHAKDEPYGLLTGAVETVESKTEATLAIEDPYSVLEALPPRFMPNATWQTSLTIANSLARLAGPGSEEPGLFDGDRLLRKPHFENSSMSGEVKSEELVAVVGDMKQCFVIADRTGSASVQLIPALFGENQRPTGQAGLYLWWRVGSKVVAKAAARVLQVK